MIGFQPVTFRDFVYRHSRTQALRYDPGIDVVRPLAMRLASAPPRRENLQCSIHGETPCRSSMETRSQIRRYQAMWGQDTGYPLSSSAVSYCGPAIFNACGPEMMHPLFVAPFWSNLFFKTGTQEHRRRFSCRQPESPDQDDAFTIPPVVKPKVPNGLALPGEAILFDGSTFAPSGPGGPRHSLSPPQPGGLTLTMI